MVHYVNSVQKAFICLNEVQNRRGIRATAATTKTRFGVVHIHVKVATGPNKINVGFISGIKGGLYYTKRNHRNRAS